MSKIDPKNRLLHILNESDFLLSCRDKYSSIEKLTNDEYLSRATIRSIEIIGEAIKGIPVEITDKYPDIPWKNIARMRDKLIHRYFEVDYQIIDRVIRNINPEFNRHIKTILDSIYRKEYLDLKQELFIENLSDSLPYFIELNKLKERDVIICKEVLDSYPSNARKIAIEEAKKIILAGD